MHSKKLMDMLSDKEPGMEMPEHKKEAIKEVLMALKDFADEMMAEDLKGNGYGEEEPKAVGIKLKVAEGEPEEIKDSLMRPEDVEEATEEPKPEELEDEDQEDEDVKKMRMLLVGKNKKEEMR